MGEIGMGEIGTGEIGTGDLLIEEGIEVAEETRTVGVRMEA